MEQDWSAPGWAVLTTLVVVVLLVVGTAVAVVAGRRRNRARVEAALATTLATTLATELAAAHADAALLRAQVESIERRLASGAGGADPAEYRITTLGDEPSDDVDAAPAPASAGARAPVVGAPLFADLVLRESVVQAASLAAGLRRALAPETRNRIRFEMRREIKRARKQRRLDARIARQEYEARQRSDTGLAERAEGDAA